MTQRTDVSRAQFLESVSSFHGMGSRSGDNDSSICLPDLLDGFLLGTFLIWKCPECDYMTTQET